MFLVSFKFLKRLLKLFIFQANVQLELPATSNNSSVSYIQLLVENAELTKKLSVSKNSDINNSSAVHPLQKDLELAENKIEDLSKALEDRISEVDLIDEKSKLTGLNSILAEKLQFQAEEFIKSQSQLQDARDQADLLEFRVLELEEENEKVSFVLTQLSIYKFEIREFVK